MNLKNRVINFEHWISSDFKLEAPKIFQKELLQLFSENKEAFHYYRNWLFTFVLTRQEKDEFNEFINILDVRAETSLHQQLLKVFLDDDSSKIFSQKRLNTFEIALQVRNSDLNHSDCFLYQQYYENEVLFRCLYSFIFFNETGSIETDLNKFKDRTGRLKKGGLINTLKQKLRPYPLVSNLFENAYNSKIRNIIGHNNYRIDEGRIISSDDDELVVDKIELFNAIYSMQSLNNYLLNYLSNRNIANEHLKNAGILGIEFGLEEERPVLSIFQLSCFYNLGEFQLSNKVIFNINNRQLETTFSTNPSVFGVFSKELEYYWFNRLKKESQLRLYTVPIIPRDEELDFITLDVGDFVIIDNGKSKDLDYEVNYY